MAASAGEHVNRPVGARHNPPRLSTDEGNPKREAGERRASGAPGRLPTFSTLLPAPWAQRHFLFRRAGAPSPTNTEDAPELALERRDFLLHPKKWWGDCCPYSYISAPFPARHPLPQVLGLYYFYAQLSLGGGDG